MRRGTLTVHQDAFARGAGSDMSLLVAAGSSTITVQPTRSARRGATEIVPPSAPVADG